MLPPCKHLMGRRGGLLNESHFLLCGVDSLGVKCTIVTVSVYPGIERNGEDI